DPRTGLPFNLAATGPLPVTPQAQALLPLIPGGTVDSPAQSVYNNTVNLPTNWREELVRVDHNTTAREGVTLRISYGSCTTLGRGSTSDTASAKTSKPCFT